MLFLSSPFYFFFFNDTSTTEIYTLSLHDALPIYRPAPSCGSTCARAIRPPAARRRPPACRHETTRGEGSRSEEHTSELQSLTNLVCRLLLEKKKKKNKNTIKILN